MCDIATHRGHTGVSTKTLYEKHAFNFMLITIYKNVCLVGSSHILI